MFRYYAHNTQKGNWTTVETADADFFFIYFLFSFSSPSLSLFYFFCPPGQSPIYAVAHTEEREETVVTSNSNLLFLYISPPYFILHFVQVDIRMLCQKKSSMLQNLNLTKLKILSISVLSEASVRQRKVHSRVMQTAQTDECSTGKENRRDRPPRTSFVCREQEQDTRRQAKVKFIQ